MSAVEKVNPVKAEKGLSSSLENVCGTLYGTIYIVLALIDVSVDSFSLSKADGAFVQHYLIWKSEAPFISSLLLLLLLLIPYFVYLSAVSVVQIFTHSASFLRHMWDLICFVSWILLLYMSFFTTANEEAHLMKLKLNDEILAALPSLYLQHQVLLALNLILTIIPIYYSEYKPSISPSVNPLSKPKLE
eukprot:TRINITY_DN8888_c0_g1_i1.p1 TRINITY_DN8888_c0_g1~~TRINITY_DN8888_c0_g1_i1.p1  ORF type:complete len:204 (+),score=15.96 TRINITY_DN8888_c0_g1_i1:47-613(+)